MEDDIIQDDLPSAEVEKNIDQENKKESKFDGVPLNAKLVYPSFGAIPQVRDDKVTIYLPSDNNDNLIKNYINADNTKDGNDLVTKKHQHALKQGSSLLTSYEAYVDTAKNTDSLFEQELDVNGIKLKPGIAGFKTDRDYNNHEIKLLQFRSYMGLGGIAKVPLWNSGFWISFKAPTELEILELNRKIINEKIQLGRSTTGLIHSATTAYMVDTLIDFAISHVHNTSIKLDNNKDIVNYNLKKHILVHDRDFVLLGILMAMYPNGFQYRRACSYNPDVCKEVIEGLIDLSKIQWCDSRVLTNEQKLHMSQARDPGSKTIQDIIQYQEKSMKNASRVVTIDKDFRPIKLELKVPNLQESITASREWIDTLVNHVEQTLGMDADIEEKNSYITQTGLATATRQYTSWIKSLEFGEGVKVDATTDKELIQNFLDDISGDNNKRQELYQAINKYSNESTSSIVAIPSYDCPACGSPNEIKDNVVWTGLIPLDVIGVFFVQHVQRVELILNR